VGRDTEKEGKGEHLAFEKQILNEIRMISDGRQNI